MAAIKELVQCDECGCYGGGHTPKCMSASPEYKAKQLLDMCDHATRLLRQRERLTQLVDFWQNKFQVIRHENNKLRKALREVKQESLGGETGE